MSDELKPCPFCGGQAKRVIDMSIHKEVVMCSDCGARAPQTSKTTKVVADWNTRTTPQE